MDEDEQKELGALVAFLCLEKVATAIFRVTAGTWTEIHLNAAFRDLPDEKQELEGLQESLQRIHFNGQDAGSLHGLVLEGGKWQIRVLSTRHCAVTAIQSQPTLLVPSGHDSDVTQEDTDRLEHDDTLDWTRHAAKNPSPWIQFICEQDWGSTALGPMESWSPVVRQYVLHIVANPEPRFIVFGERMTLIYNEACIEIFGAKHPRAMGLAFGDAWPEVWGNVKDMMKNAAYRGIPTKLNDCPFFLQRHGYAEETFWNFNMVPIVDPITGRGIGLIDEFTEVSKQVTDARRQASVLRLSEQIKEAKSLPELWKDVLSSLEDAGPDIPFAILYAVVDDTQAEDGSGKSSTNGSQSTTQYPKKCILAGTIGISAENPNLTESFSLPVLDQDSSLESHCSQTCESRIAHYICPEKGPLPAWLSDPIPTRSFGDEIRAALFSPLRSAGDEVLGVLIIGVGPRSPLNSSYKLFLDLICEIIEKAAALISLPDEQRRAQAITDDITSSLTKQLRSYSLQAERSEAKFSRMAASSPIGMFMFSAIDGRPLYTNGAYLELLGVTRETHAIVARAQSSAWEEFIHVEDM